MSRNKLIIPENKIRDLYLTQRKSTYDIAKLLGCGQKVVVRNLRDYNISGHPKTENKMPVKKGEKISWNLNNLTPESNQKRSLALKGKFIQHKSENYHPSVAVTCTTCGTVFKKKYSYWKKSESKIFYCGKPCNKSLISTGSQPWNYGKQNPIIDFSCPACQKVFKIKQPNDKSLLPDKIYCSPRCAKPYLSEGVVFKSKSKFRYEPYYGPEWIKIKKTMLSEEFSCNICQSTESGDVDHIKAFDQFNDHSLANKRDNLWRLCDSCHGIKTRYEDRVGIQTKEWWKEFVAKTKLDG